MWPRKSCSTESWAGVSRPTNAELVKTTGFAGSVFADGGRLSGISALMHCKVVKR